MSDYTDILSMNELTVDEQLKLAAEQIVAVRDHFKKDTGELLVRSYHEIGQIILQLPAKYSAVQDLHERTGISERTLYYAAAFYEKFPVLDEVPNYNWTKIVTKLLPDFHAPENNHVPSLLPDFFVSKPKARLRLCDPCYKKNIDYMELE